MNDNARTKALDAARARLSQLIDKGERSFAAELRRAIAETACEMDPGEANAIAAAEAVDSDQPRPADALAEAMRMRDAIAIAVSLLDELLEDRPRGPGRAEDIAEIFEEIGAFAAFGARVAGTAVGTGDE